MIAKNAKMYVSPNIDVNIGKKLVIKESNWVDYMGSNKFLLEDIKDLGEKKFIKEILF